MLKKIEPRCYSFADDEEPWTVHAIKTGFIDLWAVVHDTPTGPDMDVMTTESLRHLLEGQGATLPGENDE